MRRLPSGFALIYALLAASAFLAFFTAWTIGVRGTLRTARQSESLVQGKVIADAGNQLLYQLILNGNIDIFGEGLPFTFSNQEGPNYFRGLTGGSGLKTQFSETNLGGSFTVTVDDISELEGLDAPSGGTYLVSISEGRVSGRKTSGDDNSHLVFKMGSPFLNNVAVASGGMIIRSASVLSGPVLARTADDGTPGDILFEAHRERAVLSTTEIEENSTTTFVNGLYRAEGTIHIGNFENEGPFIAQEEIPQGTMSVGQAKVVPPIGEHRFVSQGIGGIEASGLSYFEPKLPLGGTIDSSEDFSERMRSVTPDRTINLDSLSPSVHKYGILVEVQDSSVTLHEVRPYFLGRSYDLSALVTAMREDDPHGGGFHHWLLHLGRGASSLDALKLGLAECDWDDPAFPNGPIPEEVRRALADFDIDKNGVKDLTDGEIPRTGDYIDHYSIEAGSQIGASLALTRDEFRQLRFTCSTLPTVAVDGTRISPPVYIRGRVEGKLSVFYDQLGASAKRQNWTEGVPPNRIVVLADDSITGVPGGLTLANSRIKMSPEDGDSGVSQDMVLLCSNGAVANSGLPIFNLRWLSGRQGFALPADTDPSFESHVDLYREEVPIGDPVEDRFNRHASQKPTPFYGIEISAKRVRGGLGISAACLASGIEFDYASPSMTIHTIDNMEWPKVAAEHPVPNPALASSTKRTVIPLMMRESTVSYLPQWDTYGGHGFTDGIPANYDRGHHLYDFRWRELDAETIKNDLGLNISPILIEKRGL